LTSSLSASFAPALHAAREAASHQHYPQGALFVVATPIGNLADITLRALHVLALVDAVACEDTRHTQQLLRAYGMDRPGAQLLAVHQHNEAEAAGAVIERLQQGQRIAYVSDAGTPAVSDPGARLVAAVRAAGLPVVPLPGASSITTALSAAGMTQEGGFVFAGFLPSKAAERERAVLLLAAEPRAVVLLEAPHRIEALAGALATLGERPVTFGRELTKQFEEIATVPAGDGQPGWRPTRTACAANSSWCCTARRWRRTRATTCACSSCCWPSCRSRPPSSWPPRSPAARKTPCTTRRWR